MEKINNLREIYYWFDTEEEFIEVISKPLDAMMPDDFVINYDEGPERYFCPCCGTEDSICENQKADYFYPKDLYESWYCHFCGSWVYQHYKSENAKNGMASWQDQDLSFQRTIIEKDNGLTIRLAMIRELQINSIIE